MTEKLNFNLIAAAGGAKNLVQPAEPDDRTHVLFSIEKLLGQGLTVVSCIDFRFWEAFLPSVAGLVSGREELILTNHEDCGAYGGSGKFSNQEGELSFHNAQLEEAVRLAEEQFGKRGTNGAFAKNFVGRSFNSRGGAHTCEGLVFACGESQAWQKAFGAAKSEGISSFDILTTFGGAARVDDFILRNIGISKRLHEMKTVVVAGHAGGACGMMEESVEEAAQLIKEKFPALEVRKAWST
jgi:hypothetical protein